MYLLHVPSNYQKKLAELESFIYLFFTSAVIFHCHSASLQVTGHYPDILSTERKYL